MILGEDLPSVQVPPNGSWVSSLRELIMCPYMFAEHKKLKFDFNSLCLEQGQQTFFVNS